MPVNQMFRNTPPHRIIHKNSNCYLLNVWVCQSEITRTRAFEGVIPLLLSLNWPRNTRSDFAGKYITHVLKVFCSIFNFCGIKTKTGTKGESCSALSAALLQISLGSISLSPYFRTLLIRLLSGSTLNLSPAALPRMAYPISGGC